MKLRPYQLRAVESIEREWQTHRSTLLVLPTGCGKTVTFAHVIARRPGRAMVIAHREELIDQAVRTIEAVMGEPCEVEMAKRHADRSGFWRSKVVVASKDSLHEKRLRKFKPGDFGTLVIDEAHHAVAATYRRITDRLCENPSLRVLGVTATPDRLDEQALGQVFETCPDEQVYEVPDAIDDGWLVPITQRIVSVESLDFRTVKTLAGDFNQKQLAELMEFEENLHRVASPIMKLSRWNRTLVFAASIEHADRLTEIFNRHRPNCARFVHGETPKDERKIVLQDYAEGKFQYLVNVGVFTEGFDDPGIGMVAIARPTKSRALYAQMIGRGTRPLKGVVDGLETPEERKAAIKRSGKSRVEILDFEGQAGTHKLVTTADVLGGNYDEDVVAAAAGIVSRAGGQPIDASEALRQAAHEKHEAKRKEMELEARRRTRLVADAQFQTRTVDPFDVFALEPHRARGWEKGEPPPATEAQVRTLTNWGVPTQGLTKRQASQLIGECIKRREKGLCTFKMAAQLKKRGFDPDMKFEDAKAVLDSIFGGRQAVRS